MDDPNKTILVTGGAKGIGRCIAASYAAVGGNVIIADMDRDKGREAEKEIREQGGQAFFYALDLADCSAIDDMFHMIAERYRGLDILINNAAITSHKPMFEMSVDEWDRVLQVNLRAPFWCARQGAELMKTKGGGAIINIASTRALMSEAGYEAYGASKGGILALTHALAITLSPFKIRVNAISPGWIETGDYAGLGQEDHLQHPAGRVGKPGDIAWACLYLSSEQAAFMNGANLVIDGGMTRKMIYSE